MGTQIAAPVKLQKALEQRQAMWWRRNQWWLRDLERRLVFLCLTLWNYAESVLQQPEACVRQQDRTHTFMSNPVLQNHSAIR